MEDSSPDLTASLPDSSTLFPESLPVLRVRWQLQFTQCNLKCPYCIAEWTRHPVAFHPERFNKLIDRLLELPYRLVIRLGIGGEFFLSKDIQDGVIRLSHHQNVEGVSFSTNLVASSRRIESFLEQVDSRRLGMGATLHDTQITDLDSFFEKVQMVQERGILVYVGYVGLPVRFEQIHAYKQRLDKMGVPLLLNEYNGTAEHVPYPEAYSAEQRRFLKAHFFSDHYYRMLVERQSPKSQKCLAGHQYIYLKNDGTVFGCGMDRNEEWSPTQTTLERFVARLSRRSAERIHGRRTLKTSLGNMLEDASLLPLSHSPRICPYTVCACGNEVQAMYEVGRQYHRTRTLRVIYPKSSAPEMEARYPNPRPIDNDSASF